MRRLPILLVLILTTGCAAKVPPSLSPSGVVVWQANEAVVALGTLQHAAIALNGVKKCDALNRCTAVFSDKNTRVVVDSTSAALNTLRAVPVGWRATAVAALDQISAALDAGGRATVAAYLVAARTILDTLGGM